MLRTFILHILLKLDKVFLNMSSLKLCRIELKPLLSMGLRQKLLFKSTQEETWKQKNKRQIPIPGDRQSICYIKNPHIMETSRENIEMGDILRKRRIMEDSGSSLSELTVVITATSVAAAILSKSKKIY